MSVIVGVLVAKTGHYRWSLWTGWTLATFGTGLLYLLKPSSSIPQWVFLNFPASMGAGMLFPSMGLGIQAASHPSDAGHAAAFYAFDRVFGQAMGVAIAGVVFQNRIKENLLGYEGLNDMADAYSKDATALVGVIKGMQDGVLKDQLKDAYASALGTVWLVMCALSGAALVSCFLVGGYSLEVEHRTLQGLKEGKDEKDERSMDVEVVGGK